MAKSFKFRNGRVVCKRVLIGSGCSRCFIEKDNHPTTCSEIWAADPNPKKHCIEHCDGYYRFREDKTKSK